MPRLNQLANRAQLTEEEVQILRGIAPERASWPKQRLSGSPPTLTWSPIRSTADLTHHVRAACDEDIACILERDPAARSTWEVLTCYPGLHAIVLHRLGALAAGARLALARRASSRTSRAS